MKNHNSQAFLILTKNQFAICFCILTLLLVPTINSQINNPSKFEKEKTISKLFSVDNDPTLMIQNSFGKIKIESWSENKIEIIVKIKTESANESWAISKLNSIDVVFESFEKIVRATTNINEKNHNASEMGSTFETNYEIKVPEATFLKLKNEFGVIEINQSKGPTEISCKFGKIRIGKLENQTNNIELEHCAESSIKHIENGKIDAKFSKINIDEIKHLELNSEFSNIKIQSVKEIDLNNKFGSITIQNVEILKGVCHNATFAVDRIVNQFVLQSRGSTISILELDSKFETVDLNLNKTSLKLNYKNQNNFDFDISATNTTLNLDHNLSVITDDKFKKYKIVKGFYQSKNKSSIKIVAEYGIVSIHQK